MTTTVTPLSADDERRSLGYLGMVLFLGSWVMMFGALFFVYAGLRARASGWPPPGTLPLPLLLPGLSSLVIVVSSFTLQAGVRCVQQGRAFAFAPWLLATIVIGSLFLALQVSVWTTLWHSGLQPSSGIYGSIFYLLTVFHFLHVVVGLGLLLWQVPAALRRAIGAPRRVPIKLISMFWHFVTIVWVAIYLTVYVF